MPKLPNRPCSQPGCPAIALQGSSRCQRHQVARQQDARPSPSARGYDRSWQRIRALYLKHNPGCVMCGAPATQVDHMIPLARGGDHDASNLQALCQACHSRKTATIDGGWGRAGQKSASS